MNKTTYQEFLKSDDTLRVYAGDALVFSSKKERLQALLEYIDRLAGDYQGVVILDSVVGKAAALLAIKAGCREVCSPLGSQLAIATLNKHGIRHYFSSTVPYIRQDNGEDMCPMEKLSLNKEPDEFYAIMRAAATGQAKE